MFSNCLCQLRGSRSPRIRFALGAITYPSIRKTHQRVCRAPCRLVQLAMGPSAKLGPGVRRPPANRRKRRNFSLYRDTSIQNFPKKSRPDPFAVCYNFRSFVWGRCVAEYSDYYFLIARAISGLPSKTEEARSAVYERARTALQKRLSAFDPPISETDLAIERFALEAAIQRVETESRPSDTRHRLSSTSTVMQIVRAVRDKLNNNITTKGDSVKAAIAAGLAQGLEFIQNTRLKTISQRFCNIFRNQRWIAKYPQIRIAARLLVAALVGIFVGIFVLWITRK